MKIIGRNLQTVAAFVTWLLLVSAGSSLPAFNKHNGPPATSNIPTTETAMSMLRADISVYPNPTPGPATIRLYSGMDGVVGVTVKNSAGATILYFSSAVNKGSNLIPVDLTHFGYGTYTILVAGAGINGKVMLVVK
ncbi:MAG: hypothetical protein K1X61_04400 [Chitinophagales bacterium]|nr:hypothetical protein [Chitinophagales bacterium]